jgi:hypothetical protein
MLQSGDLVAEHRSGGPPDPFTVATKPSRPPRNE